MNAGFLHAQKTEGRGRRSEITGGQEGRSRRPSPSSAGKRASKRALALSDVIFPMTWAQVCQTCTSFLQKFYPAQNNREAHPGTRNKRELLRYSLTIRLSDSSD
jgi:hypothetical protein